MSALSAREIAGRNWEMDAWSGMCAESARRASPLFMLIPFERAFNAFICRDVSVSAQSLEESRDGATVFVVVVVVVGALSPIYR